MKNLAGIDPLVSNTEVCAELHVAGITPERVPPHRHEVHAGYEGVLRWADGRAVRFRRAWVYWVATCDPPLPARLAHRLNELPHDGRGTAYSGRESTLGGVVRAYGFAGGMERERLAQWLARDTGVDCYHIDTTEALVAFTAALREEYGAPSCPTCGAHPDGAK